MCQHFIVSNFLIFVHYRLMMQMERERQFVIELRRVKGLEVRHMAEDGNCLFRAVADRVYGDAEMYDETRQMCIDYMVGILSDCRFLQWFG